MQAEWAKVTTMANVPTSSDLSDAIATPLGDLIAAVGRGLAEAQQALDAATIDAIKALHAGGSANMDLLRRLGYQPTWYRIPELNAEITLSMSVGARGTRTDATGAPEVGSGRVRVYALPMDASYTNRYDFNLDAASVIKFTIVPVPPSVRAGELKIVPNLVKMKVEDARIALAELGVPFKLYPAVAPDGSRVSSTVPEAGQILDPDGTVRIYFDVGGA